MMKSAAEELGALAQAIVWEQREEESRLAGALKGQSLRFRKREGLTWSPVTIDSQSTTFGGRSCIVISVPSHGGISGAFRSGSPVSLYQANDSGVPDPEGEPPRRGLVRKSRKHQLEVVLDGEPLVSQDFHARWTLDVRGDDRTFRMMAEALSHWINTENPMERRFRDYLLGFDKLTTAPVETREDVSQLNASLIAPLNALNLLQRDWVKSVWKGHSLSLLHGPPGTGKTTALLVLIEGLVSRGKRILITAQSNAAVDWMLLSCHQRSMEAVRIGHPMRVDPKVWSFSLESRVESEPEFKQVRDFRKRSAKAWKEVDRFRRNFGPDERREKAEAKREALDLNREARDMEAYIAEKVIRKSSIIGSTLAGASDYMLREESFDYVIVDEAGQAMEPAVWIAMRKAPCVILAGDPQQLPPVVKSAKAVAAGLEKSLLEKLLDRHPSSEWNVMLEEQYRMNASIMEPSSDWFYGGRLKASSIVADRKLPGIPPWTWIDTAGCGFSEERELEGSSTSNREEAGFVLDRLLELVRQAPHATIGVVAPYRAQIEVLETLWIERQGEIGEKLEFATVDAFQGQERDVMVLSLTRCNEEGAIGFLNEYRRTNVAMTRARSHLLVVGDGATLGSDPFFARMMELAEKAGAYRSAWEWMS